MFLSIIIPVYNTEAYIAECLDSCLHQDISLDEYEIVCVNDGSTDNSLAILQSYADRYQNVKIITKENTGVSDTRNVGIRESRGEYIWFVDSDDVVASNVLGALKARCTQTDCDRLLFHLALCPHDMPSKEKRKELVANGQLEIHRYWKVYIVSSLMRRRFLIEHDIWFPLGIAYGEDEIFTCSWKLYPYKNEEFDEVLYFYRTRPNSAMQSRSLSSAKKRLECTFEIAKWLRSAGALDEFEAYQSGEQSKFLPEFALKYVRRVNDGLVQIACLPYKEARKEWKKLKKTDLMDAKYMFAAKEDSQTIVRTHSVRRGMYKNYRAKRIRFVLKHPKRFLGI